MLTARLPPPSRARARPHRRRGYLLVAIAAAQFAPADAVALASKVKNPEGSAKFADKSYIVINSEPDIVLRGRKVRARDRTRTGRSRAGRGSGPARITDWGTPRSR